AYNQFTKATLTLPICNFPVGEGANLVITVIFSKFKLSKKDANGYLLCKIMTLLQYLYSFNLELARKEQIICTAFYHAFDIRKIK
ncbi:hypothetical protein OTUT144_0934, partial [Orientia tsutsugamushi str. UT144]